MAALKGALSELEEAAYKGMDWGLDRIALKRPRQ